MVLSLPGDRASVVKPGTVDVRVELADTSSIYSQPSISVKFETLRSGLFLRYGATDKLELGLEVPVLYRYDGFMEGAITYCDRAGNNRHEFGERYTEEHKFCLQCDSERTNNHERRSWRGGVGGYDIDE